ncbi:MAG TPA: hypothetical protein VFN03_12645, partial [Trueperaceae bacterium]|nr:hypothetical protein [Trueperaceae bacterium]
RLEHDPSAYLDLIRLAARAEEHTGGVLNDAVLGARSAGNTWEVIGQVLGMSRQAAQQRFGGDTPVRAEGETKVLRPLTAFNEMAALEEAGKAGWHSVGYGALYHVVERSETQWEHLRLFAAGRELDELRRNGWQQIGFGWFPWTYLKRQLDLPAVTEA